MKKNFDDFGSVINIPKDNLIELVKICFDTSYFMFRDKYFLQLDGSAMSNPASPSLANLVMNHVLKKVRLIVPFEIAFLKLYVDDTLLAVPADEIDNLLGWFNSIHPNIQFTIEKEVDNRLAFLDMLVIRTDVGELRTKWYQKPTSSGRLLNFKSHHPIKQKNSVVLGLLFRALKLSHAEYHVENLKKVREILNMNNYPRSFVDVCLKRFRGLHMSYSVVDTTKIQENRFRFPFIKGLSHLITLSFRTTDLRPVFYNLRTVGEVYSKVMDKTPMGQNSELVYKIMCSCGKSYVGQTRQYLSKRIYQHRYSCNDKFNDKEDRTALANHHFLTGHIFDFEGVVILDRETNWLKRNISEMVHISLTDTVNLRTDTENLSNVYLGLINKYKLNGNKT